ncbi:hypothetical protein [Simkania negevensis]|uniref:WG repeat-containing protein n=1 Tax=Simkania negevensis (strain ATCC VR-1471 / DSM 27360 / Z) TaxID=331113 RepID=F8L4L8_SIMNZ|nr:hypothetical protein [Simkania negevensis]CCB88039.1 unknown protein [Simkania negevensis Z]
MKFFRFLLLLCLPPFLLTPIPSYAYHIKSNHELFIPRDKNKLINPWGYFHPQTILTRLDRYADHVFGFVDGIGGARFNKCGQFIGFLEP